MTRPWLIPARGVVHVPPQTSRGRRQVHRFREKHRSREGRRQGRSSRRATARARPSRNAKLSRRTTGGATPSRRAMAKLGRNSSEHRAHAAKEERHPSAEGGPKGSVEAVADGPASHQAIPTRARWATDENARGSAVCDAECLPCDVATWRTRIFRASKLVVELWPLSALLSALCSLFTPHPPRGPWPPVCPPVVPMVAPLTRLHAFVGASFISVGLTVGHYPSEG